MTPFAQIEAIAHVCGTSHHDFDDDKQCRRCMQFEREDPTNFCVLAEIPDYLNDLNAMHSAEKFILESTKLCSSNPENHEPMRYLIELAKVVGLPTREELVISISKEDEGKLNFRPGPYPTPIQLPPSAIVLGHSIPAYGHELDLIRATAGQRAEAFLKTLSLWRD